jgi:hypothetical protein
MSSAEQVAWQMYRELSAADRRIVDSWRDLGNDLVTSLLNSRVVTSGHRRRPADDLGDWSRRMQGTDPTLMRANTCEHEAAHAIVAQYLGATGIRATVDEDGRSGVTTFTTASRSVKATIAAAAEVWITEYRALAYPGDTRGFSDDRHKQLLNTDGDHEIREARRRARLILAECRQDVLDLAEQLNTSGHVTLNE